MRTVRVVVRLRAPYVLSVCHTPNGEAAHSSLKLRDEEKERNKHQDRTAMVRTAKTETDASAA